MTLACPAGNPPGGRYQVGHEPGRGDLGSRSGALNYHGMIGVPSRADDEQVFGSAGSRGGLLRGHHLETDGRRALRHPCQADEPPPLRRRRPGPLGHLVVEPGEPLDELPDRAGLEEALRKNRFDLDIGGVHADPRRPCANR